MPPVSFLKKQQQARRKKQRGSVYTALLHEEDASKKTCYINITILDASEAIYGIVHSKVQETHKNWLGTQAFKDKVAHTLAKTASQAVHKKDIVKKLSNKIPKMLMYEMYHKMGLRLAAQVVYREDNYAVVQIQVQHVDAKRLLATAQEEARKGGGGENKQQQEEDDDDDDSVATAVLDEWIAEQKSLIQEEQESPFVTEVQDNQDDGDQKKDAAWLDILNIREALVLLLAWILHKLMPVTITRELEDHRLPALIQSQITACLQEKLDKKLASKNMRAETAVLLEEAEARYFFAQLQKIRNKVNSNNDNELATAATDKKK